MPIKKIHVGFSIDAEMFMKLLQHAGNMKIEVFGDEPKKDKPKLLAAPGKSAKSMILDYIKEHAPADPKSVGAFIVGHGYARGTASSQIHVLLKEKRIRRVRGNYIPTEKANG